MCVLLDDVEIEKRVLQPQRTERLALSVPTLLEI
jgi:hypothetical protein